MPNLEERASSKDSLFFILSHFQFSIVSLPLCITVCFYENSDQYNIDRINLVSFIHCRYLFNRGKD